MKKLVTALVLAFSPLLIAAGAAVGGYHGSSKSNIYHLPSCTWAKKISKENLLVFPSKEDAQKKAYRPCKICKP